MIYIYIYIYVCAFICTVYDTCIWECWLLYVCIAKNAHVNRCNPVYFPMYTGFLYVHRASFCVPAITCILEK